MREFYKNTMGSLGVLLIKLGRFLLKKSLTHCTLCLREYTSFGEITEKGFRCYDVTRDCSEKDYGD